MVREELDARRAQASRAARGSRRPRPRICPSRSSGGRCPHLRRVAGAAEAEHPQRPRARLVPSRCDRTRVDRRRRGDPAARRAPRGDSAAWGWPGRPVRLRTVCVGFDGGPAMTALQRGAQIDAAAGARLRGDGRSPADRHSYDRPISAGDRGAAAQGRRDGARPRRAQRRQARRGLQGERRAAIPRILPEKRPPASTSMAVGLRHGRRSASCSAACRPRLCIRLRAR